MSKEQDNVVLSDFAAKIGPYDLNDIIAKPGDAGFRTGIIAPEAQNKGSIYGKLSELQWAVNRRNTKHHRPRKTDLRTYTGLLDICNPCLRELGLVIMLNESIINVNGCNYLQCKATLASCDGFGPTVESNSIVEYGVKASEKARYYALTALLMLDDYGIEHDKEQKLTDKVIKSALKINNQKPISEYERRNLVKAMNVRGVTEKEVLEFCKVETIDKITKEQYQRLLVKMSITD